MNAEISETLGARLLRFGMQIPELLTQRKFVSAACHARKGALVEYLIYQIPVTQLKGPKGNGDMQAAKRD